MSSDDNVRIGSEPEEDETLVLTDEAGRTLTCSVERYIEIEGKDYVLLVPVDAPVEIFVWEGENEDDEEALPVEDDSTIDMIFSTAKAVLEEQNLTLKRTAMLLTVEGDLPVLDEDEDETEAESTTEASSDGGDETGASAEASDDDGEELQLLASFYYEEQEFAIYAPLDPCFILARLDAKNQPHILSATEMEALEPRLAEIEDQLFDDL